MAGRCYDAWRIGDRIVHEIRRTVTETDNLLFSIMTHNPRLLQLDAEASKASEIHADVIPACIRYRLDRRCLFGRTR